MEGTPPRGQPLSPTPRPPEQTLNFVCPPPAYSRSSSPGRQARFHIAELEPHHGGPNQEANIENYYKDFRVEVADITEKERPNSRTPLRIEIPKQPSRVITQPRPFLLDNGSVVPREQVAPRWPAIVRRVVQIFVFIFSIIILALMGHSLVLFESARSTLIPGGPHGMQQAWPVNAALEPNYLLVGVALASILTTAFSLILSLRQKLNSPMTVRDAYSISVTLFLLAGWVAGTAVLGQFRKTNGDSLICWACDKADAPVGSIIPYGSVCAEQTASVYIGALISILETLFLGTFAFTFLWTRRQAVPSSRNHFPLKSWATNRACA
ncbi:hypothetical protein BDY21DRAFT_199384 [Lineolata rhizophorae]|uniref:Uncharacterized protein n=1 Tax=Lineolata rhizophorae TaxID=578093 RepID=A0A6A6P560_9PEZI|nr:hypothetical protein BDY21DRAFT_199384 [Lineolata rhizophorae]